jgi:hypothetical protein
MRKMLLFSIVGAVVLSGCGAASLDAIKSRSHDPSRFTYTRVYCTPDGETHFETMTIELPKTSAAPPAPPAYLGGNRSASGMSFGGFDPHWGTHDLDDRVYHPAPAAVFTTVLGGVWSVTATDGETRRFSTGDAVGFEDTAPCKGHISVNVSDQPGFLMFVW